MQKKQINKQEKHLELLRYIQSNPYSTQRNLAVKLDISLGKINFFIKELIKTGFIKIERFSKSKNKSEYSYLLTSKGLKVKSKLTYKFMIRKFSEYEKLKKEYYDTNKKA